MTAVFERILKMSLMAAVVIAVVLIIRLCLRRAPRKYAYALWSVAAFRLVCPVSFKAVFSVFRLTNGVERMNAHQTVAHIMSRNDPYDLGVPLIPPEMPSVTEPVPPVTQVTIPAPDGWVNVSEVETVSLVERVVEIAAIVWLIGLAALLIYGVVSYLRLRRRMSTAVLLEDNIWQSDRVQSPFILGFVRPKIYLPFGLTDDQRRYVLAHERYHLKRLDHIIRPLSYLILAVHWFNPLVWLAYYLMARDMEMSCDEKVLSAEENIRKEYSTTLLSFAANRRFPSPSPLAFGESGVKGRIKNALNWKKPRTWVTVIAVIVCIVVIIVCAANPKEPDDCGTIIHGIIDNVTAEDLNAAYLSGEGLDSTQLTEAERERLAELLSTVTRDELGDDDVNGIGLGIGADQLQVTFPWGGLVWKNEQLYIGWIDSEGGSVFAYRFVTVDNAALTGYVVNTLGGLTVPMPESSTPHRWAQELQTVYIQWADLLISGEEPVRRTLSDEETAALVQLLNGADGSEFFAAPENGAWNFPTERMVTVCCGGTEYKLSLGPEPMTLSRDGGWQGTEAWHFNSDAVKDFIRSLPEQRPEGTDLHVGLRSYESEGCFYWNSARADAKTHDSGYCYAVGDNLVLINDADSGDVVARFAYPAGWRTLTLSDWSAMFTGNEAPDLSDCIDPRIRRLSNEYALLDLDGTLFMAYLKDVPMYGYRVWDIYRLSTASGTVVIGGGYVLAMDYQPYESAECLYQLPYISSFRYDSGKRWFIGTDRVTIYNKYGMDEVIADFAPAPVWQILTEYNWEAMFQSEMNILDISGCENVLLCTLSEEYALMYVDGELWAVETRGGYVWAVWRMEPAEPEPLTEVPLAVWQADLTHDGADEIITLTRENSKPVIYTLTVTSRGETLWERGVTSGFDQQGYYLYQKNGKSYLMQWAPVNAQGSYNYNYQVFSLTGEGETVTLTENSLQFDMNTPEAILALNIGAVRSFGDEVNALLTDTQVLAVSNWEGVIPGDPADPKTLLWDVPVDDFERQQQYYQNQAAQRKKNTLAVWPLNDLTVTVLKTEDEEVYKLDVYQGDYFFWESEIRSRVPGLETYYFIYREDGVEYLAEFTGLRDQGAGLYSYQVFSVGPESREVLYQNSIYYHAGSEEDVLTMDIEAIAAFEREVNALFKDADLICGTGNGRFFWNAGGPDSDMVFHWYNPDLDQLQQEQQRVTEEQNAIAWFQEFLALNPGVNWYNHAMNDLYDTPSELDLSLIFHGGFGEWDGWEDFTAEEEAWLIDQGFHRNMSAQKRPAEELEAVLNEYFNTSLNEVAMPDSWVYCYETDSFYSNTNDVHAAYRFTVTKVDWTSDGLVRVWYEVGDTYLVDPDTGKQVTHAVLTLRAKSGDPYNDPMFVVVSHQSSLDFDG